MESTIGNERKQETARTNIALHELTELNELQLAAVGGGIGDVTLN